MQSPTGYQDLDDPDGNIVYLGNIRRNRVARQSSDANYLFAIALSGLLAWATWFVILLHLPPTRLLSYLAFFLPMGLALAASSSLAAYWLDKKAAPEERLSRACRHGALLAAAIIINLVGLAAHRWNPVIGAASIAIAVLANYVLRA